MRRRNELPELLAPAGSMQALLAAVEAGADAVYVGGKSFGARAYAENFDLDGLRAAVEYCHIHGVKLYVTVNTLVFDRELAALSDYAALLYRMGVDALICADLGAIREIRRRLPDFEIHASTQMSIHNTSGAVMAAELGCTRVVPARELSLRDIVSIVEKSPVEVEVFLHGALCVCHSGQCLMSSMVGGRSGNRGECAQPCRLPYNRDKYLLSLKDLSLADHIGELIDSGVASLKIEGRMKSAQYVYNITKIYRTLLDERRGAVESERRILADTFSRGGFTDGYFVGKTNGKMTGVRSEEDKERTERLGERSFEPMRVKATASIVMRLGEPSRMTLTANGKMVCVSGAVPATAESSPLTADGVKARLAKMGNTYISLAPEDIDIQLDEGINLAPSAINALRRDAAAAYQSCERKIAVNTDPCEEILPKRRSKRFKTATFFAPRAYSELTARHPELVGELDIAFLPLHRLDELDAVPSGVYIPPVVFDSELDEVGDMLARAAERGVKYALVSNIGAIALAKKYGLVPIGDFRLNVTNALSRAEYERLGVCEIILSPELTLPMARDIGGGVITLGRIPLMLTERCFMRESVGCEACAAGKGGITDRKGARFPMLREYRHRNLIFNSALTYMGDRRDELCRADVKFEHFIFSVESADRIAELMLRYKRGEPLKDAVRRIGKR
ncbi:MAG: U32 family peptidase [Clostridia bacterium]|nr:U32 family peptidase [Clostridia bacterium]